jgi:hypothetical protein
MWGDVTAGEIAYHEAHAVTVVASGGRVVTFDPSTNEWAISYEARTAEEKEIAERYGSSLVYDAVNERIVFLGGMSPAPPDSGWASGLLLDTRSIVAFDVGSGSWTTLFSPAE